MTIEALASSICGDIVHSVAKRGTRSFLVTNFRYPDGDLVVIYLESSGKRLLLTDSGNTMFKLRVNRVGLTDTRAEMIDSICRRSTVEFSGGELKKELSSKNAGLDFLRFCETITRVSSIQFDASFVEKSLLMEKVSELLNRSVVPIRSVSPKWNHELFDPNADYPVDFHVNSSGEARNIFYVGSGGKSTLVGLVSSFLKLHNAYVPTLSIVDPDIRLGAHHVSRLQQASTEVRYGISGYEDDIVRFALSGMVSQ